MIYIHEKAWMSFSTSVCFSFPQECPSGVVNEETFKNIYSQFFPQGGLSDPSTPHFNRYLTFRFPKCYQPKRVERGAGGAATFPQSLSHC